MLKNPMNPDGSGWMWLVVKMPLDKSFFWSPQRLLQDEDLEETMDFPLIHRGVFL
jgi:hypothetical protein